MITFAETKQHDVVLGLQPTITIMADRNIVTGHYVRIEQMPARTIERIGAFLIDVAAMMVYSFVGFFLVAELMPPTLDHEAAIILFMLPAVLYFPLLETLLNGQTLGKYLLRTRVVKADGSSPDAASFLLRWLLMPVDVFFFGSVAFFSMLVTIRRQRVGDLVAGTMVIKLNTYANIKVSLDEFAFVHEGYEPCYPKATQLSSYEAETIQRALADRSTSRRHRLEQLAQQMRGHLELPDDGRRPEAFLAQLLSDYRYYDLNVV